LAILKEIYKPGYGYQKCGVQLSAIQPRSRPGQLDLFEMNPDKNQDDQELMAVIDQINRRFHKSISIAATGMDKSWKPKAERISKRYTTEWQELVYVK
jgi:DNA polymerase V